MGNELLLIFTFNNKFSPRVLSFCPSYEEHAMDFKSQFLHTNINDEPFRLIDWQHKLLKNKYENEDKNKVVKN